MGEGKHKKRGGLAQFGAVLDGYLQASGLGKKLREFPVLDAWSAVVGTRLGVRARAVSFVNGQLEVEVDSAAHRQELVSFTGEEFRKQANKKLGREEIISVVFKLKR